MEWESDIPGCFGNVDQIFAVHPLDARRAFDLLTKLRALQPPWDEVMRAFERHLRDKGCGEEHIKEQLRRVESHYAPWLR